MSDRGEDISLRLSGPMDDEDWQAFVDMMNSPTMLERDDALIAILSAPMDEDEWVTLRQDMMERINSPTIPNREREATRRLFDKYPRKEDWGFLSEGNSLQSIRLSDLVQIGTAAAGPSGQGNSPEIIRVSDGVETGPTTGEGNSPEIIRVSDGVETGPTTGEVNSEEIIRVSDGVETGPTTTGVANLLEIRVSDADMVLTGAATGERRIRVSELARTLAPTIRLSECARLYVDLDTPAEEEEAAGPSSPQTRVLRPRLRPRPEEIQLCLNADDTKPQQQRGRPKRQFRVRPLLPPHPPLCRDVIYVILPLLEEETRGPLTGPQIPQWQPLPRSRPKRRGRRPKRLRGRRLKFGPLRPRPLLPNHPPTCKSVPYVIIPQLISN